MDDNLRHIDHEIDKRHAEAETARRQAVSERSIALSYSGEGQESEQALRNQTAESLDAKADKMDQEAAELEKKKEQIVAKINELKAEREKINRETVDRTYAIDKELASLSGGMTI